MSIDDVANTGIYPSLIQVSYIDGIKVDNTQLIWPAAPGRAPVGPQCQTRPIYGNVRAVSWLERPVALAGAFNHSAPSIQVDRAILGL